MFVNGAKLCSSPLHILLVPGTTLLLAEDLLALLGPEDNGFEFPGPSSVTNKT